MPNKDIDISKNLNNDQSGGAVVSYAEYKCPNCGHDRELEGQTWICGHCGLSTKRSTFKQRALATHELLFRFLEDPKNDDLEEFTKGGISACCVILGVENPVTGHEYSGDPVSAIKGLLK